MSAASVDGAHQPVRTHYEHQVQRGQLSYDAGQLRLIEQLDQLYQSLIKRPAPLTQLLRSGRAQHGCGLYIWGSVGRGKTMLMDWFFDALPLPKQRLHFHQFMQQVHAALRAQKKLANPMRQVAHQMLANTRVLCLDEFQVTDIVDAMLLAEFLPQLFMRGLYIIITTNTAPDALYLGGLQRQKFLPTIALLQQQLQVIEIAGGTDHRAQKPAQGAGYRIRPPAIAQQEAATCFAHLSDTEALASASITVNDRTLAVIRHSQDTLWVDFAALCVEARATEDYTYLCKRYRRIILTGVHTMNAGDDAAARRFIHLIDELYAKRIILIIFSQAAAETLYCGQLLRGSFKRTTSRLLEMQSTAYFDSAPQRSASGSS